ncbi:MAG: histidine phosphatase family protein [Mycobacterium sp.]
MTDVLRLTLVSHGMTDAMAAGRFPSNEALNALGVRQCASLAEQTLRSPTQRRVADLSVCSPEERTRQTAELLDLDAQVDPRLCDVDCGRWRGQLAAAVPSDALAEFLSVPAANPHGGESITALIARVRAWLEDVSQTPRRVMAVVHPAIVRAAILVALDAPPKSFWRIDIEPASRTTLHYRDRMWSLRSGDHR